METQNIAQNWRGTQIRLIKDFLNERRFVRVPAGTIGIILSKAPERDTLNYIVISIRFAGKHYPCHNVPIDIVEPLDRNKIDMLKTYSKNI